MNLKNDQKTVDDKKFHLWSLSCDLDTIEWLRESLHMYSTLKKYFKIGTIVANAFLSQINTQAMHIK
jgi:hypothetical protein